MTTRRSTRHASSSGIRRMGVRTGLILCLIMHEVLALGKVSAADWIGGDQSATQHSWNTATNWDPANVPDSATETAIITADGSHVNYGNAFFALQRLTLGSVSNPNVSLFLSFGAANERFLMVNPASNATITGSNTVLKIASGTGLRLVSTNASTGMTFGGGAVMEGTSPTVGGYVWFDKSQTIPGGDYHAVSLRASSDVQATYSLAGNVTTANEFRITGSGSGGTNKDVVLNTNNHTINAGSLSIGNIAYPYFGRLNAGSSSINITSDLTVRSDSVNGTLNSAIISSGIFRIGGNFAINEATSLNSQTWDTSAATLEFNGGGSSTLEVMSHDIGLYPSGWLGENFSLGKLVVSNGTTLNLADAFDNHRAGGAPEALYLKNLSVATGSVLNLQGVNVYLLNEAQIDGNIDFSNGGTISVLQISNYPSLEPGESASEVLYWNFQAVNATQGTFIASTGQGGFAERKEFPAGSGEYVWELTDTSDPGGNAGSAHTALITKANSQFAQRVEDILKKPAGSDPVEFILQFEIERTLASNNPVLGTNGRVDLQFGNSGADLPRFPISQTVIGQSSKYNMDGQLERIDNLDFPSFRFTITPNGGSRLPTSISLTLLARVETGATPESFVIDNVRIHEITPPPSGTVISIR